MCFRASAGTAARGPAHPARDWGTATVQEPWSSPCLRVLHDASVCVEHTLLQAVLFPDLNGEERKEKSNNSYVLWDSSFCFGKESSGRSQRARENERGDFCAFFFFYAAPVWFQWVCVWTRACFEKKSAENFFKREDSEL